MTLERMGLVVIGRHTTFILEASSVKVEYSVLVCDHFYSLCCEYIGVIICRVYVPTSIIAVCSLKIIGVEQ